MRKRTLGAIAGALVLLALLFPTVGGRLALRPALERASARLGRPVRAVSARLGLGTLRLDEVVADGMLRAKSLEVEVRPWALLGGRTEITAVRLEEADVVLDRKATRREAARGAGGERRELPRVTIVKTRVTVRDPDRGLEATIDNLDADFDAAGAGQARLEGVGVKSTLGPSAHFKHISVELPNGPHGLPSLRVEGGRATVWRGLALSGINGTITPTDEERLQVALRGGYLDAPGELWSASGEVLPRERSADVDLKASRFTMDRLAPVLDEGLVLNPQLASVDAALRVRARQDRVAFDGRLEVAGLTVFHPGLADDPIADLSVKGQVRGELRLAEKRLEIDEAVIERRGVTSVVRGAIDASKRPPRFELALKVPPVPCKAALAALPAELVPTLQGFKLDGRFGVDLTLVVDKRDLEATDIRGTVGIDGCKVVAAPKERSAEKLLQPFEHSVPIKPGEDLKFIIGPENPDFAPIQDISPHLINTFLTTEDGGFFKHRGFISSSIREALRKNVERGTFRVGASTITMQMVKNVLLAREKTLARKLQELFLTWYVERSLPKERILEIYLNAIEFGPRLYGIGRATRHYFGKPPKDLTPREAAFFGSILPSPKRRYVHYCSGAPNERWEKYLDRILLRMHERGRLAKPDLDGAVGGKLVFDLTERGTEKQCLERIKELVQPSEPDVPDDDEAVVKR